MHWIRLWVLEWTEFYQAGINDKGHVRDPVAKITRQHSVKIRFLDLVAEVT
jgi:hypothetical protein